MSAVSLDRPQRLDLLRWKRRSRMIAVFRRLLPALIAIIILSLAAQVVWNSVIASRADTEDKPAPIRMTNPRFQGREGDGRSFVISAATATRDDHDLRRVTLDQAVVTLGVDTPKPTRVTANTGVYVEGEPIVKLNGNVQVDDGSGYHFTTERANLNTRTNVVDADSAITGVGPAGEVQSDSYAVYDQGDRVIFRGRVRAKLKRD